MILIRGLTHLSDDMRDAVPASDKPVAVTHIPAFSCPNKMLALYYTGNAWQCLSSESIQLPDFSKLVIHYCAIGKT
jgi:hypothetical protein